MYTVYFPQQMGYFASEIPEMNETEDSRSWCGFEMAAGDLTGMYVNTVHRVGFLQLWSVD